MSAEQILELVVMLICTFGCGVLWLFIGFHAKSSTVPANFWAGSPRLTVEMVADVASYNAAYCKIWVKFSVWYFAAGVFSVLGVWYPWADIVTLILLILSGFPGLWWLIRSYKAIEKEYVKQV